MITRFALALAVLVTASPVLGGDVRVLNPPSGGLTQYPATISNILFVFHTDCGQSPYKILWGFDEINLNVIEDGAPGPIMMSLSPPPGYNQFRVQVPECEGKAEEDKVEYRLGP